MAKILVVEDDPAICSIIVDWLTHQHHTVEVSHNGLEADQYLKMYQYDVIVLDWGLPELSGVEICKRYKTAGGRAPVLMLTGKHDIEDKEEGFNAGADDYLTKPFDIKELSARVRALLRRPTNVYDNILSIRNVSLDPNNHIVTRNGAPIKLTPKEFAVLEFFMRNPNKVFKADALLDHIWNSEAGSGPETVRTCIKRLRRQIDEPGVSSIIENVHGVGYKLASQ
ncbi:MAG: response regulator transcription factor [Candidatus Obscuribacterales bacterium]|nr:response regulator transcription factor [Cyanobacteria bacterium SZAS LIN-5]RTL40387.1 MAG: response regulator transcription factor [Candidatus Melainabacteria bacterium]